MHGSGDKEGEGKVGKQTAETFYLQKLGKQAQEKRQQEEKSAKQDEQLAQSKHSAQQYKLLHQGALKKLTQKDEEIDGLKTKLLAIPRLNNKVDEMKRDKESTMEILTKVSRRRAFPRLPRPTRLLHLSYHPHLPSHKGLHFVQIDARGGAGDEASAKRED